MVRETATLGVVEPLEKIARTETANLNLRFGTQVLICLGGVVLGKGMLLLLQVLLGRLLGVVGYGLYSLGFSVVAVIVWLASAGLDWGVLRYCALYQRQGHPERVKGTLWMGLGLGLAASLLVGGLLFALANLMAVHIFSDARLVIVLRLFSLSLPVMVLVRTTATFVQSQQEIYRMTVLQHVSQPVLNLLLVIAAFLLGWGLKGAVGAYLASLALTAALGFRYVQQTFPAFFSSLRSQFDLSPLVRYSLAMTVIGVSYQLLLRTPNLLLGRFSDARAVGVYTAGASFAMVLALLPGVFAQPFMPMMVELYEGRKNEQLRRLYRMVTRWTSTVVVPISILLCLFREEIMAAYGRDFRGSSMVLLLLSGAWLVYFIKGPGATLLDMTGRQNIDLLNMLGIGVLTIALNWLLIPRHGALGAAWATSAAMVVWAGLECFEVWVLFGILPWGEGTLRQFLVASVAVTGGFLLHPRMPWPLAAAATLGVYSVLFPAYCLIPEDREFFHSMLARLRELLGRPGAAPGESYKLSSGFCEPD